jgi:hypothetical protein
MLTSTRVSGIWSIGHSETNDSEPGGGSGQRNHASRNETPLPPPPRAVSSGPSKSTVVGRGRGKLVAVRPLLSCTPKRKKCSGRFADESSGPMRRKKRIGPIGRVLGVSRSATPS